MPDPTPVQLRVFRRDCGLLQSDLAHLLGYEHVSSVSRLETGQREPDARTTFACEYALSAPASALFASLFSDVVRVVSTRARSRLDALSHVANDARADGLRRLLNARGQTAAPLRCMTPAPFRVMAVAPVPRGLGVCVLDEPATLIYSCVKEIRERSSLKNASAMEALQQLLNKYAADVVVLEDHLRSRYRKRARISSGTPHADGRIRGRSRSAGRQIQSSRSARGAGIAPHREQRTGRGASRPTTQPFTPSDTSQARDLGH